LTWDEIQDFLSLFNFENEKQISLKVPTDMQRYTTSAVPFSSLKMTTSWSWLWHLTLTFSKNWQKWGILCSIIVNWLRKVFSFFRRKKYSAHPSLDGMCLYCISHATHFCYLSIKFKLFFFLFLLFSFSLFLQPRYRSTTIRFCRIWNRHIGRRDAEIASKVKTYRHSHSLWLANELACVVVVRTVFFFIHFRLRHCRLSVYVESRKWNFFTRVLTLGCSNEKCKFVQNWLYASTPCFVGQK
jgi:hypothetical protein